MDKLTASAGVLSFISSLLIAAVGGYFTYSYNQRQIDLNRTQADHDLASKEQGNKVLELEAIQKLIPSLTSKNETEKAAALTAIQDLAHPALAADLAVLFKGQGSVQYLQQAVVSPDSKTRQTAVNALKSIATSGQGADAQGASRALIVEQARQSIVLVRSHAESMTSVGSGFCIAADGVILTAAHVISRPTDDIVNRNVAVAVILESRTLNASVVSIDYRLDIAVLKTEESACKPLSIDSGDARVGTEVLGDWFQWERSQQLSCGIKFTPHSNSCRISRDHWRSRVRQVDNRSVGLPWHVR